MSRNSPGLINSYSIQVPISNFLIRFKHMDRQNFLWKYQFRLYFCISSLHVLKIEESMLTATFLDAFWYQICICHHSGNISNCGYLSQWLWIDIFINFWLKVQFIELKMLLIWESTKPCLFSKLTLLEPSWHMTRLQQ